MTKSSKPTDASEKLSNPIWDNDDLAVIPSSTPTSPVSPTVKRVGKRALSHSSSDGSYVSISTNKFHEVPSYLHSLGTVIRTDKRLMSKSTNKHKPNNLTMPPSLDDSTKEPKPSTGVLKSSASHPRCHQYPFRNILRLWQQRPGKTGKLGRTLPHGLFCSHSLVPTANRCNLVQLPTSRILPLFISNKASILDTPSPSIHKSIEHWSMSKRGSMGLSHCRVRQDLCQRLAHHCLQGLSVGR